MKSTLTNMRKQAMERVVGLFAGLVRGDESHQHVYGTACLQADGSWLIQQ